MVIWRGTVTGHDHLERNGLQDRGRMAIWRRPVPENGWLYGGGHFTEQRADGYLERRWIDGVVE